HNRRGGGIAAWYLRSELSGEEFNRGRGVGVCFDSRARSARCGQSDCFARGRMEQKRILESARIVWSHVGAGGRRQDWPGDDPARAAVRKPGHGVRWQLTGPEGGRRGGGTKGAPLYGRLRSRFRQV